MFTFNELKQIHLEISSNCQAKCPMCTRNIHGGIENPNLKISDWTLEQYKKIISEEVINQVEMIYFCGNYGDPLLNNNLIDMIAYTVSVKKEISIRVHTNGSLRSTLWWKQLATALPTEHMVVFAIDGLEDTHSIYRIGTNYDKIIENAKAFIEAGGKAEWAYIRFKHNEHQVNEAKRRAIEMGFKEFVMKDSSRWLLDTKFPVLDKSGKEIYTLEPSQYTEIKFIDKKIIDNYKSIVKESKINCHALNLKEIYITAQGHLFPCCWLAMIPYQADDRDNSVLTIRNEIRHQYTQLVDSLGGHDAIDPTKRSVREIIDSVEYQTVWDRYWGDEKLIMCARICGVAPDLYSTPKDQFRTREILNG